MNWVRFNVPLEEYGATLVSNTHLLLLDKYRVPLKKTRNEFKCYDTQTKCNTFWYFSSQCLHH